MSEKKDQLDRIESRLDAIDVTLAKNTVLLDEHIKRTNLLEEEVKPIKTHVQAINMISKWVAGILAVAVALKELGVF